MPSTSTDDPDAAAHSDGPTLPDGRPLPDDSTVRELPTREEGRSFVLPRRIAIGVLTAFVLLGLVNGLGVRSATATSTQDGWTVAVTHPAVARAGLDVPLLIEVTSTDGFDPEIDLVLRADYFDMFESQRFFPEPSAESRDGELLHLTFDAPPSGTTFRVGYDAYIQPSSQIGRTGSVAVVVDDVPVAQTSFRTTLLP